MAGLAGKNGTLKIGATDYPITSWELSTSYEMLEDSNSLSSGRTEWVAGFSTATGSVTGYHDLTSTSTNPITAAKPGTSVTLLLHITATEKLSVPVIVSEYSLSMPVKGKIEYTLSFQSTGYDLDTDIVTIAS